MGFLQQSLAFVDLVLHQVQLRVSLHLRVGVKRPFGGHQLPLDRLSGSSDLALVAGNGSTQLARVSLSRAIGPGHDQEVTASHRWNPVVDCCGFAASTPAS